MSIWPHDPNQQEAFCRLDGPALSRRIAGLHKAKDEPDTLVGNEPEYGPPASMTITDVQNIVKANVIPGKLVTWDDASAPCKRKYDDVTIPSEILVMLFLILTPDKARNAIIFAEAIQAFAAG